MGLFAILHNLVLPLTRLAERRDYEAQRRLRERSLNRLPPHLRDDIVEREKTWRYD